MAAVTLAKILKFSQSDSSFDGILSDCGRCGLRGAFVCGALEGSAFADFAGARRDNLLKSGETLYSLGGTASQVYNLTKGVLKLSQSFEDGRTQIIAFAFPGDFLGLSRTELWNHSAEALTGAKLCAFEREHFYAYLESAPAFKAAFAEILERELHDSQEQLLRLGRKTAVERVASFLLVLSSKATLMGAAPDSFALPMSRQDISDFLCLSTETVSRALSQLKRAGVIATGKGRRIDVRNLSALGKIAHCRPAAPGDLSA